MIIRDFLPAAAGIFLSGLLCGNMMPVFSAEVVNAYRKPAEADIQWILAESPSAADSPQPAAEKVPPDGVVNVAHSVPADVKNDNHCLQVRLCEPYIPARPPQAMIPPAPEIDETKKITGLAPETDSVAVITPVISDLSAPVIQMGGQRLPPPPPPSVSAAALSDMPKEPLPDVYPPAAEIKTAMKERFSAHFPHLEPLPEPCGRRLARFDHKETETCDPAACDPVCGENQTGHHTCGKFCGVPEMSGGAAWFSNYWVGADDGDAMRFALPTMFMSRPNVIEHFNAEVQTRIWADYRHWNNAAVIDRTGRIPYYENRGAEQFSFGLEWKVLKSSSAEIRVPLFYQFASGQTRGRETAASAELGNVSVFVKQVLKRNSRWTLTGGAGVMIPTAEDCRSAVGPSVMENNLYYFVSFLGVQWHPDDKKFGQFVVQADIPFKENLVMIDRRRMKAEGQQAVRAGIQAGRWIYRSDDRAKPGRLGLFAEVDYAVVTDGTPLYQLTDGVNSVFVSPLRSSESVLSASAGVPAVFGRTTLQNTVFFPLTGHDRPFSAGYSFSLTRKF
ncbi:MAG: hypothetical protein LBH00_06505 [Planctomycetaceae bacterium]|jgi:hypothetical protein|nr:hypothetical protein [Planctomycetaceae bacterium]